MSNSLNIEKMIYIIRGQKVMLDSDLANLYGVETRYLNRQVRRNQIRFPTDFVFELTKEEFANLMCQNGTSSLKHGGRRKYPLVFTENGVAMLSSVLRSEKAALVNVSIMRIFTKLRSFLLLKKVRMIQFESKLKSIRLSLKKHYLMRLNIIIFENQEYCFTVLS